jgi:hypothetical protein
MLIAAAVESLPGGKAGRIRLATIENYSAATLQRFVADNTVGGSTILTDGFSAYPGMRNRNHMPKVVGTMAAHSLLHGSTGSFRTSSGSRSASTMGSAASIFRPTSTSSSSAGTEDATTDRRSIV